MNFDWQAVSGLLYLLIVIWLVFWVTVLVLATVAYARFQLNRRVQRWQEQSEHDMQDIEALLKPVEDEIAAIKRAAQPYSPRDPEPYGATAAQLHATLAEVQRMHKDQAGQLDDLSKNVPMSPGNLLARFLFGLGPELYQWRQHAQRVEELFKTTRQFQDRINEAKSLLKKLNNRPLEVARLSRALKQTIEESRQIAKDLGASNVRGDKLRTDTNRVEQLVVKLLLIPSYFRQGPYILVKRRYHKEDVIAAWAILKEIEAPSEQCLKDFQQWQSEYRTIGRRVTELWDKLATIKAQLAEMASSIGPLTEVKKLEDTVQSLKKGYDHLPIEHFADFDIYVTGATAEVNLLAQQVKDIMEKLEEAQKEAHQADAELRALIQVRHVDPGIKESMSQANSEWKVLKNPGNVSKVLGALEALIKIYDQMMRQAERQIWGYMTIWYKTTPRT